MKSLLTPILFCASIILFLSGTTFGQDEVLATRQTSLKEEGIASSKTLISIPDGSEFHTLSSYANEGWYPALYKTLTGWVNQKDVARLSRRTISSEQRLALVTASKAILYKTSDSKSKVLLMAKKGAKFNLEDNHALNGWYKIVLLDNTLYAWMRSDDIVVVEP